MTNTLGNGSDHPPKVLVTYGSKSGATAGIAEIIGTTLRDEGIVADVRPASQVRALTGYDAWQWSATAAAATSAIRNASRRGPGPSPRC
jgi:hypothetical protein